MGNVEGIAAGEIEGGTAPASAHRHDFGIVPSTRLAVARHPDGPHVREKELMPTRERGPMGLKGLAVFQGLNLRSRHEYVLLSDRLGLVQVNRVYHSLAMQPLLELPGPSGRVLPLPRHARGAAVAR